MFFSRRIVFTAAFFLVIYGLVVVAPVSSYAQESLDCQNVWKGKSDKNDILKCLINLDRIKSHWKYLIYPAVPALLFVITLITFPFIFCYVACCRRNGVVTQKNDVARLWVWMWITYSILWSCAVAVFVIYGFHLLSGTIPYAFKGVSHTLVRLNETGEKIVDFASNWSSGKREPVKGFDLDTSFITDAINNISNTVNTAENFVSTYTPIATIGTYVIGGVVVGATLLVSLLFCCRCSFPHLSLCTSCLYWIFGILFSSIGVALLLVTYLFSAGCGEIDMQYKRLPGVFQWYVVPFCEKKLNLGAKSLMIDDAEKSFLRKACKEVLDKCDNDPRSFNKFFQCNDPSLSIDKCTNFGFLDNLVKTVRVKAILTVCPQLGRDCTIAECAAGCKREDTKFLSQQILDAVSFFDNTTIALSYARPVLDCNFILDNFLGIFAGCNDMRQAFFVLGTGFFVGGLTFGLGLYILFRGTCVWTRQSWKTIS